MRQFLSLAEFWQTYVVDTAHPNTIDTWSIVFMAHDQNQLFATLADPITEQHQEVFVNNVTHVELQAFIAYYRQHFYAQLPLRFGFFKPTIDKVLTEYPNWQTFYKDWLNDDPGLLQANMPLLFDYPSELEYRAMQLKQTDPAGYRRLNVVLYQYRKQQFQKIFIKHVDDQGFAAIKQQIMTLFGQSMPELLLNTATERQAI